jgi:hypothetical protein
VAVDLRSETGRLVVCGGLVAAGVVTAAALAPAAAGAAVGVGVFTGLVNALSGIAGNILATDGHAKLAKRLDDPERLLQNHDLTRAVADAIAVELQAAAKAMQGAEPLAAVARLLRGQADPAGALRQMARKAPEWWPGFVSQVPARGAGSPTRGHGITEAEITGYISKPSRASEPPTALTRQVWQELLLNLADYAEVTCPTPEVVADRLHKQFAVALREIIKHDAATGGKAYPALHLLLLGDILGAVREIGDDLASHEGADAARHTEVMQALQALRPVAETVLSDLAPLLEEKLRTEVTAALRVTLDAMAESERRLTELISQEHELTRTVSKKQGEETRDHVTSEVAAARAEVREGFNDLRSRLSQPSAPLIAEIPEPGAVHIYEPRDAEKEAVAAGLVRADGSFGVAALVGMAGVGKTYLAELIAWERRDRLPGGMLKLELGPELAAAPAGKTTPLPQRVSALAAGLCARYGVALPAGMDSALALHARLTAPLSMLLIENVDAHDQVAPVSALLKALPGVPTLVTGRCATLLKVRGWIARELEPFDRARSDSLLNREMDAGSAKLSDEDRQRLFEDLGGVPLAIRIAASHIRRIGGNATRFLQDYHKQRADISDAPGSEQEKNLRAVVAVSVAALMDVEGPAAVAALARMAWGPAAGMGADLARMVSGLDGDAFGTCCASAMELSVARLREGVAGIEHVSFHPLVAEVLRADGDEAAALDAMTDWFVALLPEGGEDQGERWRQIQGELPALERWLGAVPETRLREAERKGSRYAMRNGPFRWWAPLCERLIASGDADDRSNAQWTLGNVQHMAGDLDAALATTRAKQQDGRASADAAPDAEARDRWLRVAALAAGLIADILGSRGELDEALRIRREEQLPVYERLGDVRERAVTMGKIADILGSRGELDEALRILQDEALPDFQRLGDVRSRAVTMGKIAGILQSRGELGEALRIRREEELPVYDQLEDVRSHAVTMGKIADILQSRGELDEALRIRREEQLPVYDRLEDVRERAVTMGKIADILQSRGELDEALRIRREEELPVYERLEDVRGLLVGRTNLAMMLALRGRLEDGSEIAALLASAHVDAVRLGLPEAGQIAGIFESIFGAGIEAAMRQAFE